MQLFFVYLGQFRLDISIKKHTINPIDYINLNNKQTIMNQKILHPTELTTIDDPHFIIDMMYARPNNILGRPVYKEVGFGNQILVHPVVKDALLSLIPALDKLSCKMRICDAYRPPIAHTKCVEAIPIKGFFKPDYTTSNHCHGTAVDVCLTDLDGNNLVYPTEIDAYEPHFAEQVAKGQFDDFQKHLIKARHDYYEASLEAIQNRETLKQLMESHGFESIPHEWWHYNIKGWQNYPVIDWHI